MTPTPPITWSDGMGSLDLESLRARYAAGELTPTQVVTGVRERIAARGDDHVWLSLVDVDDLLADAARVERLPRDLPLWGVPFGVKDNIDVAGLDTTAACPGFAYRPARSAAAVQAAVDAGAIVVGKTNLDQFATGLNGTRSPYGAPSSPFDPQVISGGSSSGSGVAVSSGEVSFTLGTDTAGSGRVPAAFGNVVGLKPSVGLVSTDGVLPACRSIDCTTVFAATVRDAAAVLHVIGGSDETNPRPDRSLPVPPALPVPCDPRGLRLGVPDGPMAWGSRGEASAWDAVCASLTAAGVDLVPLPMEDFLAAGAQLYGGAWLAERLDGLAPFVTEHPDQVEPVILEVLAPASRVSGTDVFESIAQMELWRRATHGLLAGVDALLTPTTPETFTIGEMLADPVALNARLGRWTTFTNLLDLCAVAVPGGFLPDGLPFGISVQAPAGHDEKVAAIASALERLLDVAPGASTSAAPTPTTLLAVVGAHLVGQPLHGDLLRHGATFVATTTTAPSYRLWALQGTRPPKPGLERVADGGAAIEVEVYAVPTASLGAFVATIPAPLGIGRVELADGRSVHGFICEPLGLVGADDITVFGGWRAYLSGASATA